MIKKRIKKIWKLTILIAARQIWKLLCNLYHLLTQPLLTIKLLIKDRDKSQIFLLILVFLMPVIAYVMARIIWDYYRYGALVRGVGMFFVISAFLEIGMLIYLVFWMFKAVVVRK